MQEMPPSESLARQARRSRQQPELSNVKFRSSCDQCSEAKVRCDKHHPQCGRCVRTGGTCRYSVSMRTGKPTIDLIKALNDGTLSLPSDRLSAGRGARASSSEHSLHTIYRARRSPARSSAAKSPTPPPSHSNSASPPAMSVPFQDLDRDLRMDLRAGLPGSPSPPAPAPPGLTMRGGELDLHAAHDVCTAAHSSIDVANLMEYFSSGADAFNLSGDGLASPGFSLPAPSAMDLDYFAQMITPSSTDPGAHDGAPQKDTTLQQPQSSSRGHSCLRATKGLQQSINMMASRDETTLRDHGVAASAQPITTTDQALLMCSSISKQLIEILQCRCEADAYLPFLITVIFSKLLATYGAIAKVDESTLFSFSSSKVNAQQEQDKERPQQQRQQEAAFVSVPLRLGAYDVDGELEGVLRAQLVLHELSKLESVVQLFEEKYCSGGEDPTLNEDRTIYLALRQFIKQRYMRTKAACDLTKT